jgi:translation initiation factor IF-1
MKKLVFTLVIPAIALTLTGCWTPPNANVQPPGEPRLIQSGVPAGNNHVRATVQSIEAAQRVLNLKLDDGTAITCTVNPSVENFDQVQPGDRIKVALDLKLAVYVLKDGKLPGAGGKEEAIPFIARVQTVDPSYRLLKVQFTSGQTAELKAGLDAKLLEMQPGDAVVLQSAEATNIHIEKK